MAIFSKKSDKVEVVKEGEKASVSTYVRQGGLDLSQIIISPRITEKSAAQSEANVYTFEINARANKSQVSQAIVAFYKVTPLKIAIINIPTKYAKNNKTGRRQMKKPGMKKALVYVKKGETISFV